MTEIAFLDACRSMHDDLSKLFWVLLTPLCLTAIVVSFFGIGDRVVAPVTFLKRAFLAVLMLVGFEFTLQTIDSVTSGLSAAIGDLKSLSELIGLLSNRLSALAISWTSLRESVIYGVALLSYLFAYLTVFLADTVTQFVWAILYVCSPLMILCYVLPVTSRVTRALYSGLFSVGVWKILWSILGTLLLRLASDPKMADSENFVQGVTLNLTVGIAMILVPFLTKSLLSDGFVGIATQMEQRPISRANQAVSRQTSKIPWGVGSVVRNRIGQKSGNVNQGDS